MLHVLYLIGVSAFAASGVLAAHRANMDPFGGLVLAFAASISGGTLRDLMLDRNPLYWTQDWLLLTVIAGVGIATMVYLRYWQLPQRSLLVVDAIGLAVVTVIGARAAIDSHVTPLAVIILAVITGVAGEVIRDVLCGEFPPLLLREDVYATAALAGAAAYLGLHSVGVHDNVAAVVSACVVFALRVAVIWFGIHLPRPRDAAAGGGKDNRP
ncbi:trimeric intracellular cation channel family protein [Streptomyces pathocidini]|uniref:Trimeric intracellular cation channel family protein n=1 Tax=Streptomyces pathocidini TaxID=1650571 RepID=A0ABW7USD6_9ACTN|nr:trimeric intracellular cation channel family protein [Streptomyces pathocidini]